MLLAGRRSVTLCITPSAFHGLIQSLGVLPLQFLQLFSRTCIAVPQRLSMRSSMFLFQTRDHLRPMRVFVRQCLFVRALSSLQLAGKVGSQPFHLGLMLTLSVRKLVGEPLL
ncbi:hypothetical protein KC316_g42 [Hortaea werneckii]|nr:hypothetical protein KC316_g42 [Hortaea werneckii]